MISIFFFPSHSFKGLKQLKHHLIPRTRGFTYTVNHLKDHVKSIFNAQLEFETEGEGVNKPTFTNILKGKPLIGHLYLERTPIDQVPTSSVEELNEYLFNLYQKKDVLTEEFLQNKTFKTKYTIETKPRLVPLLNMVFWLIVVLGLYISTFYLLIAYKFYTLLTTIIVIFALIGITALGLLVRSTKAVRGSAYGTGKQDKKTS